jgi:GMP synthase-like glutamine amidotransferase
VEHRRAKVYAGVRQVWALAFHEDRVVVMARIGVLQNCKGETAGVFAETLAVLGHHVEHVQLFQGQPVPATDAFDGWIVMGGPMNVDETDRYPYLAPERDLLAELMAMDRAVLGVCLGSQLLARAAGARVYPKRPKEIGLFEVQMTPAARSDPLLGHFADPQEVFQWHGDTYELPAGAVQLARSHRFEQQAFRFGRRTYGLQFHLECTLPMVQEWCQGEPADLDGRGNRVLAAWKEAGLESSLARQATRASTLIRRWSEWLR